MKTQFTMTELHLGRRSAAVLDTLRDEILTGQYRPGERLPSERELAARFETSRGAVREALKKLEQIGLAAIHPGGVRVQPLHEASLDVLGPLLDLQAVPDIELVDQVAVVLGLLVSHAAGSVADVASDAEIDEARTLVAKILERDPQNAASLELRMELGRFFMKVSGNLAIRLIANSMRLQFATRLQAQGLRPVPEPKAFRRHMRALDAALAGRDSGGIQAAIGELMALNRSAIRAVLEAAGGSARGMDLIPTPPSRGLPSRSS
ncbi:MAG: FadR family transcriptional regulator [Gammaproteobacteria bacterium]|nr:MAG: FadR family transcriptional regulator [Gammaproteobacteria bacterium]